MTGSEVLILVQTAYYFVRTGLVFVNARRPNQGWHNLSVSGRLQVVYFYLEFAFRVNKN